MGDPLGKQGTTFGVTTRSQAGSVYQISHRPVILGYVFDWADKEVETQTEKNL